MECVLRRQRLLYAPKLMQHAPPSLLAMLQTIHSPRGDIPAPWSKQLVDDLRILQSYYGSKLSEMPDPQVNANAWALLMIGFASEWSMLVKGYFEFQSPMTERVETVSSNSLDFVCNLCDERPAFKNAKALASHQRTKHKLRNPLTDYLDDSGICPVCSSHFHNRVRLLAHVSETRKRSKTSHATCRELLLRGAFPKISVELRTAAGMKDREMRRAAQRAGRSHVLADLPAKRRRLNAGAAITSDIRVSTAPTPTHTSCADTRRRLRCKTTVPNAVQLQNGMLASTCIVVQEACSQKRRRTSQ